MGRLDLFRGWYQSLYEMLFESDSVSVDGCLQFFGEKFQLVFVFLDDAVGSRR